MLQMISKIVHLTQVVVSFEAKLLFNNVFLGYTTNVIADYILYFST